MSLLVTFHFRNQEFMKVKCYELLDGNDGDLESLTGVNFQGPVIDCHSLQALSIANHLHNSLFKHRGPKTVYRMSLQLHYAHILKARGLFNDVDDDSSAN